MTSAAGNGSNSPQTWSARLLGVFMGPRGGTGGSDGTPDPGEILPTEERKAAMSGLDPMEAKWSLGAFVLATVAGIAIPAYIIAENKVTKRGKDTIAVAPDAKLLGGVLLLLCVIGFLALWKRKRTLVAFDLFLLGFGFALRRARRVRLHPPRRLAHAAGLAPQQVRHHQLQGDCESGAGPSPRTRSKRGRQDCWEDNREDTGEVGCSQATNRQQALHAQVGTPEKDPQAHRIDPSGARGGQPAGSTRSAERSSWSTSARRRTSERAVGSSPSARSTSTSVTMPITVE